MRNLLTQTEVGSDMTWTKNKCGSHYDKESDLRALLIDFERSQIIRDVENWLGSGSG